MERWLSSVLAQRLGVWANPWFPFPRTAIELILEAGLGPLDPRAAAFAPDALSFRIAAQLPALLERPSFVAVARYLGSDPHGERLLALSRRLAANFDQYLVYRPDLVLGWEQGEDAHFQAELWRTLCAGSAQPPHLARRIQQLLSSSAGLADASKLPERISLFGLSTVPPAFLNVLRAAARHTELHMFLLAPAQGYWGDLDRSLKHHHDVQGLLANLGRSGRELNELILAGEEIQEAERDLFVVPSAGNILAGLQADLAELTQRGKGGGFSLPPRPVLESDDSLRVHSCHSRTRELEVLRDELRDRLERDPSLLPSDIVVFAPDIERYAPVIEAVFGASAVDDATLLPFRIADRRTQRASELSSTFLALLDLLGSRMALSDVVDLLHRPLVRRRFDIDEAELDTVQAWLSEAGARWSIDARHRESFGQPGFAENSLRFAVDRLLLGYASADGDHGTAHGVLPCELVEGQASQLLGQAARYVETLSELALDFASPRSVSAWSAALTHAIEATLEDEAARNLEQHALRGLLSELAAQAEAANFSAPISMKGMRSAIEEQLERVRMNATFLTGGITFCEHVPMRAIPFRVVCLLGMDDESFPRSVVRASFDLMQSARLGDRNLRDDDRQLFLEALLSARDALLISYVGRSAQDDSVRPKSALVDHLLRVIDRHFVFAAADHTLQLELDGNVSQGVTREHALHRFDRRYFRGQGKARFFSYDGRALAAARAQLSSQREPPVFVGRALVTTGAGAPRELPLAGLERFFRHPQRAFLRERLALSLPREIDPIADREPTLLDALERYQIGDDLLGELAELPRAQRARHLTLAGRLPPGSVGSVQLDDIEALVAAVRGAEDAGAALPDRDVTIELESFTLVGRLDRLYEQARVEHTVSTIRTKHKLSAWIRHLVLCATGVAPARTLLIGRKKDDAHILELSFVPNAREELESLASLYRLGMHMPLPYLHDPAQQLIDKLAKGEELASALASASHEALPAPKGQLPRDGDDAHVRQVFSLRQLEHLDALSASDGTRTLTFAEIAQRILLPMQRHAHERSS
jgi:exodeoxyribonuclease V gamma subunit